MNRAWVSWSAGKDSALALHETLRAGELEVTGLLTTVADDRVAMSRVRRSLLEAQAAQLGLPLHVVELPWPCPNDVYEQRTADALRLARDEGVTQVVYGDLFLADIRAYREATLAGTGLSSAFPLWGRPTDQLARTMLDVGLRARLVCVDAAQVPAALCGREFDEALLRDLPATADPCGEGGEFHTFVYGSPDFDGDIEVATGASEHREGFVFTDLLPVPGG